MKVVFFNGIPGSGKSSVAEGLSINDPGVYHLSIGNHLRAIAAGLRDSAYVSEIHASLEHIKEAKPLENQLIQAVILEYIDYIANQDGLIVIEPYPRTVSQIAPLLEELRKRKIEVLGLVNIVVDQKTAITRMISRGNRLGEKPISMAYAKERARVHLKEVNELQSAMGEYMQLFTLHTAPTIKETVDRAREIIPYSFTQ